MGPNLQLEMKSMQHAHSVELCGLVANLKDRSVSDIAIRCLFIVAEHLESRDSQEEVLTIFEKLTQDTHWHAGPIQEELKHHWGWSRPDTLDPAHIHNNYCDPNSTLHIAHGLDFNSGVGNPLLDMGDFSMDKHPYQGYYVAPHHHALDHFEYSSFSL